MRWMLHGQEKFQPWRFPEFHFSLARGYFLSAGADGLSPTEWSADRTE
jgi:hypothetical protein